jgi:hypothetical protein
MKGPFADFPLEYKKKLVVLWKRASNAEREHFINQVTYALASWGFDKVGKELVAIVIEKMLEDGSTDLSDFGLYVKELIKEGLTEVYSERAESIKKAAMLIESYRFKHELPLTPHKGL